MNVDNPHNGGVANRVNGGIFFHAVIQGRDVTIELPQIVQPALYGLPPRTRGFTGRDVQMHAILDGIKVRSVDSSHPAVYLISGLGGIGKTELSLQVAHAALAGDDTLVSGTLFVDLFGYDEQRYLDAERALVGLLQSLGIPEDKIPQDRQGRARLYRSILSAYADAGHRILVVIDNASSEEQVSDLLPGDSSSVAVVTSRHNLNIGARIIELGVLDADASVELMRRLLNMALGDSDERVDAEIETSYRLAELCGHLPLALHICAALLSDTPKRPVSSLVESLQRAQSLIDKLHREDVAVRAVFDLSYARLPEQERRLLGFLSFSPGPDISTAAAARLIDQPEDAAEQILMSLSRAHLIEASNTWGRWRCHDLVRMYALEAVADVAGQEEALLRLLDYYSDYTYEASCVIGIAASSELFSSRDAALAWLDAERQNLIATVSLVSTQEGISGYAVTIAHGLARYLDIRRLLSDWKTVMEISLEVVRRTDNSEFEASALDSLGMAHRELYQFSLSISYHSAAVEIARTLGDEGMLARFLNNLGNALIAAHDHDAALRCHSEAATLFRAVGNQLGFARATDNAASALRELGREEEALEKHEAAIKIFRALDHREGEARSLSHMGSTLLDLGRIPESVAAQKKSVRLLSELSLTGEAAHILNNLSNSLRVSGDLEQALTVIDEAMELHEANSDLVGQARAYNQRGLIHEKLGDFDQAALSFQATLATLTSFDGLIEEGYAYGNLGRIHSLSGRHKEAVESLSKAAEVFERHGQVDDQVIAQQMINILSILITAKRESEA